MLALQAVLALAAPIPDDAVLGFVGPAGWRAGNVAVLGFSPDGDEVWAAERGPWLPADGEPMRGRWYRPYDGVRAASTADGATVPGPASSDGWLVDADGRSWWLRSEAPPGRGVCRLGADPPRVPLGEHWACPDGVWVGERRLWRDPEIVLLTATDRFAVFASWEGRQGLVTILDAKTGESLGSAEMVPHPDIAAPTARCGSDGCVLVTLWGEALLWRPGEGFSQPGSPDGTRVVAGALAGDGRLVLASEREIWVVDGAAFTCRVPYLGFTSDFGPRRLPVRATQLAIAPDDRMLVAGWPGSGGLLAVDLDTCEVRARPVPLGELRPDGDGWAVRANRWLLPIDAQGAVSAPVPDPDPARWELPSDRCVATDLAAISPGGTSCAWATDTAITIATHGAEPVSYALADLASRPDRALVRVQPRAVAVEDGAGTAALVAEVTWQIGDRYANDILAWVLHPAGVDRVVPHVPEQPVLAVAGDLLVAAGWAGVGFYGPEGAFLAVSDLPGEVESVVLAPGGGGVALVGDDWLAFYAIAGERAGRETGRWEVPEGVSDLVWGPRELLLRRGDGALIRLDPVALLR
jgi:hypothetical protein